MINMQQEEIERMIVHDCIGIRNNFVIQYGNKGSNFVIQVCNFDDKAYTFVCTLELSLIGIYKLNVFKISHMVGVIDEHPVLDTSEFNTFTTITKAGVLNKLRDIINEVATPSPSNYKRNSNI